MDNVVLYDLVFLLLLFVYCIVDDVAFCCCCCCFCCVCCCCCVFVGFVGFVGSSLSPNNDLFLSPDELDGEEDDVDDLFRPPALNLRGAIDDDDADLSLRLVMFIF